MNLRAARWHDELRKAVLAVAKRLDKTNKGWSKVTLYNEEDGIRVIIKYGSDEK